MAMRPLSIMIAIQTHRVNGGVGELCAIEVSLQLVEKQFDGTIQEIRSRALVE
jgi:hypothetical protein